MTNKKNGMKKFSLLWIALFAVVAVAQAQERYMVVNSERVFKAIPRYNEALKSVDQLAEQYQQNVDAGYANIEKMYNEYMAQRAYLTESARQAREDAIIQQEQKAEKYQKEAFGPEGELMKKRVELIKPIQDAVFAAINRYAAANNYGLVVDVANNPAVLYYAPAADKTDEIIKLVQQ